MTPRRQRRWLWPKALRVLSIAFGLILAVGGGLLANFVSQVAAHDWGSAVLQFAALILATGGAVLGALLPLRARRSRDIPFDPSRNERVTIRFSTDGERRTWVVKVPDSNERKDVYTVEYFPTRKERDLVVRLGDLEKEAEYILVMYHELGSKLPQRKTIYDLRANLHKSGIWSNKDVEDFDRVVKVRNAIVHRDVDEVHTADVNQALRVVDRLAARIETSGKPLES